MILIALLVVLALAVVTLALLRFAEVEASLRLFFTEFKLKVSKPSVHQPPETK